MKKFAGTRRELWSVWSSQLEINRKTRSGIIKTAISFRVVSCVCMALLVGALFNGEAAAGWTQTTVRISWPRFEDEAKLVSFQDQLWCGISYSGLVKSVDGTQWDPPISVPWKEVDSFSMLAHAGGLWVIGTGTVGPSHAYSSDDGVVWVERGFAPGVLYHSSLSFDGKLWVLGGIYPEYGEGNVDDVVLEGEKCVARKEGEPYQWRAVNSVFSSDTGSQWQLETDAPWSPRNSHSSVVFNSKMWVMGGFTDEWSEPVNDVWCSEDGKEWGEVTPNAPWSPRAGHASVAFDGKIWVLGGATDESTLNDVWYSEDGVRWSQVTEHAPWEARSYHSCTVYQDKLWLAGGGGSLSYLDVWVYERDTEGEGAAEGEGAPIDHYHTADQNQNQRVDLSEILRVIQFYNLGDFHCAIPPDSTEDGYAPGVGDTSCAPHDSDYAPQDWRIGLSELLRLIQFFNAAGYTYCPESGTEDGFCPAGQ